VLDPRIYRAAFLPILFALVLVAFSVRDQPRALTTTLAPDAFDGAAAWRQLQALDAAAPLRPPGSPGDRLLAMRVAAGLRANGFRVRTRRAEGRTAVGTRTLETVIGERTGFSSRRIVVIAHRDALGRGAPAQLSATATLLGLAQVLGGRTLGRTLVLVSTSGGSAGAAAAAQLAADPGGPVDAVLALGDLAAARAARPFVVPWSSTTALAPLELRRTVERAVTTETTLRPGGDSPFVQFARLAFPLALGEQAPFVAQGIPAVLLSAAGERPASAGAAVSPARLTGFGRATLRSVSALDGGADVPGAATYFVVARKLLPAWPVRLLAAALLLPVLLASVDALARVRRRREQVGMWLRWVGAAIVPFALAALFAVALRLTGLLTAAPGAAVPAGAVPVDGAALASVLVVLALGWLALRPLLLRVLGVRGRVAGPGAATATMLVLCGAAVALWAVNPFACLLLVPALHLWLLAAAPEVPAPRIAALAMFAAGLLPPLLVAIVYAQAFGLDPLQLAWGGLLLVAGGGVGIGVALLWCVVLGCAAGVLAILLRAQPGGPEAALPITVRGPATYAGPGSLGGTESALRR
jgi:hypothetical protein